MSSDPLTQIIVEALRDLKAFDIEVLDVRNLTSITDTMIIASGNSDRQVKALADNVLEKTKEKGYRPLGVEGQDTARWILIDFGDCIVHVMYPETRDYYQLEKLWAVDAGQEKASS